MADFKSESAADITSESGADFPRNPQAHVPVVACMSREKPCWPGPGHALVDERASAREGWEREGGVFVHHVSAQRAIAALRRLGFTGERPTTPVAGEGD